MDFSDAKLGRFGLDRARRWWTLAALGWGITLIVLLVGIYVNPKRTLGFGPYWRAANNWEQGKDLYIYVANKGFVYSPFAAVNLTPLTIFPNPVANAVWKIAGAAFLLAGMWCVMKVGPFSRIPARLRGLVCLLSLPLSLSNLDTGQANALVIGLILLGVAAAYAERWTWAALAIALATHWKVYPAAVGMLIMLLAPWKFGWRFVFMLVLLGLVPFLFQKHTYVADQYVLWVKTRTSDNRLEYKIADAPLDFWFIAVRMMRLPLSETGYKVMQLGAAGGIALFCLYGRWRRWERERIFGGLLCLVCGWMLLFGPASEWLTYILLAPVVALALVECFQRPIGRATRVMVGMAYGLLLLAAMRNGFAHNLNAPILLAMQPFGAIFFLIYGLLRYGRSWPEAHGEASVEAKMISA
ncbi:hypothetical protein BH09VER1_BH09VER1_10460 [soil metagenome]